MDLYIDTSDQKNIELTLKEKDKVVLCTKIDSYRAQSEKLLPGIDKLLKSAKIDLNNINNVYVKNEGDSFSALRIGVVTANAIGFAMDIPVKPVKNEDKRGNRNLSFDPAPLDPTRGRHSGKFSVVEPKYSKMPNITIKNNRI